MRFVNRRRFIALSLGAGAAAGLSSRLLPRKLRRVEQTSHALGAEVSLVAYHENETTARRALTAAFKALDELEEVLSLYRPQSQLCELNRERILKRPHRDLLAVVGGALDWARLTDGAFDPTVQPLWTLHAAGRLPDPAQLEKAREYVDWRKVRCDSAEIRLGFGQEVTLNGIAPGFAADRVREVLRAHGIEHALANTGEFGAVGGKPDGRPWQLGIQHPRIREAYVALATVSDRFLSTSGDYETTFSDDYSRHHIFDPATGRSPAALSSVTVLASTGLAADALSTAIFVLGPGPGFELAAKLKNVDVLLVMKNGDVMATPGFPKVT